MEPRVFAGVAKRGWDEESSYVKLYDDSHLRKETTDSTWFHGLIGHRVRITVEDLGPVTDTT